MPVIGAGVGISIAAIAVVVIIGGIATKTDFSYHVKAGDTIIFSDHIAGSGMSRVKPTMTVEIYGADGSLKAKY